MTILGISGSLRRDSHNTRALRAAADYAGEGVSLEIWEGLKAIPPYDEDDDGPATLAGDAGPQPDPEPDPEPVREGPL